MTKRDSVFATSTLLVDPWAPTAASFRPLCRIAVPQPLLIITQQMIQVVHPSLPINFIFVPPTPVTRRPMLLTSVIPQISLRSPCHLDLIGNPKRKLIRCNRKSRNRTKSSILTSSRRSFLHLQLTHTRPPGGDGSRSSWRRTKQATGVLLQWNRWSCQSRTWRLHR